MGGACDMLGTYCFCFVLPRRYVTAGDIPVLYLFAEYGWYCTQISRRHRVYLPVNTRRQMICPHC